jgi:hypothetical protein
MGGCHGEGHRVARLEDALEDAMTEPWTAKKRDELVTRVSRTTVLSGVLAIVATAGISYGLASATTAQASAETSTTAAATTSTAASTTAAAATTTASTTVAVPAAASTTNAMTTSGGS